MQDPSPHTRSMGSCASSGVDQVESPVRSSSGSLIRRRSGRVSHEDHQFNDSHRSSQLSAKGFDLQHNGMPIMQYASQVETAGIESVRNQQRASINQTSQVDGGNHRRSCYKVDLSRQVRDDIPLATSTASVDSLITDSELDAQCIAAGASPTYYSQLASCSLDEYTQLPVDTDDLVETPESLRACYIRMRHLYEAIEQDRAGKATLLKNLHYAINTMESSYVAAKKRIREEEEDISEAATECVPDEVRDWLASTFTRTQNMVGSGVQKPRFRSVANAIRAGIFVERIYRRMSSCTNLAVPPNVMHLLKAGLDSWSFDVFSLNEASENHALKFVGFELFHKYDLLNRFQINSTCLENLLLKLEAGYSKHENPYHNLIHAADVTQTCHTIVFMNELRTEQTVSPTTLSLPPSDLNHCQQHWLTDLDIFALLFAALIHDFEHTGTTNGFHIATKEFRMLVIDMVLCTDMSLHFQQIKNMKTMITLPETVDKTKALSLIVHCADISHPAKQWQLHEQWTNMLCEEFFRQGDREKELNLAISPLCDRSTVAIAPSQMGFIDFIVEPCFQVMGDMIEHIINSTRRNAEKENNEAGTDEASGGEAMRTLRVLQSQLFPHIRILWLCLATLFLGLFPPPLCCQLHNLDEFAEFADPEDTFTNNALNDDQQSDKSRQASPPPPINSAPPPVLDEEDFEDEDEYDEFGSSDDEGSDNLRRPAVTGETDEEEDEEFESIPIDSSSSKQATDKRRSASPTHHDSAKRRSQQSTPGESQLVPRMIPFSRHWIHYRIELLLLTLISVYLINFSIGRSKNQQLAQAWIDANRELLEENFALIGDDGLSEPNSGALNKESEHQYSLYLSGRACVESALIELRLVKRQCFLSGFATSALLRPLHDRMVVQVTLDEGEMDGWVMAIGRRRRLQQLVKDHLDLAFYCPASLTSTTSSSVNGGLGGEQKKSSLSSPLPDSLTTLSEIGEATSAFLNQTVCHFLTENEQSIEYIFFSDQYTGPKAPATASSGQDIEKLLSTSTNSDTSSSPPQKTLLFSFFIGNKGQTSIEDMEQSVKFLKFVFFSVDKVRRIRLSKESKAKSERNRQRAHDTRIKSLQAARQEAAQSRRDEKMRAVNERIMSEDDPDKARKLESKAKSERNRQRAHDTRIKSLQAARQEAAQSRRDEKMRAVNERIMSEDDPDKARKLENRVQRKDKRKPLMKMVKTRM